MEVRGRASSWTAILVLVLLTGGAAAGSVATAPTGSTVPVSPGHSTLADSTRRLPRSAAGVLRLARRGLTQSFVATYRLSLADQGVGSDNSVVVVVAQRGGLADLAGERWFEPGPGEWSYLLEYPNGERLEMVKRSNGLYSCDRTTAGSWQCDGPDRYGGGNGVLLAVAGYEPATQFNALEEALVGPPPADHVVSRPSFIAGLRLSCLTAGPAAQTWCYTARGLPATWPASPVSGSSGTLVRSSASVPRRQFILPVHPRPWRGPL